MSQAFDKNCLRFLKKNKLVNSFQFGNVFTKPLKVTHVPWASVYVQKNNVNIARIGITVAKKRFKLAIARNKQKRLLRESFRMQKNILSGLDIVFVVKKELPSISVIQDFLIKIA